MKWSAAILALAMSAASLAPAALACGYEDPAAMQKGILNWVYPKSLYVDTAVWRAQQEGYIAVDPPLRTMNKLLVNPGYRRAVRTLDNFATLFPAEEGRQSFVVLLLEAMLWSRVTLAGGEARATPHIVGVEKGEAVIVTHRVVLEAISSGRLSPGNALEIGVMRIYGSDAAIGGMTELLERASLVDSDVTGTSERGFVPVTNTAD